MPLWKFKIQYIKPIFTSSINNLNQHLDVSAIQYNSQTINENDMHLSLRKLSSKYPTQALSELGSYNIHLEVKMDNENYVLLKKINSGALY